jgi:hypothetical protein
MIMYRLYMFHISGFHHELLNMKIWKLERWRLEKQPGGHSLECSMVPCGVELIIHL